MTEAQCVVRSYLTPAARPPSHQYRLHLLTDIARKSSERVVAYRLVHRALQPFAQLKKGSPADQARIRGVRNGLAPQSVG